MQMTIQSIDSAPAPSRPVLEGIATDLGAVPNLAATIAESPTLLAAFDALRRAVGAAGLDPVDREVAGLAVGVAVDNAYGVAFHSTVLGRLGVDDAEIEAMRAGTPPDDPTRAAFPFQWALGARDAGHDAEIFLAGEATYLMKNPVADAVLPVGMPPLRELIDEVLAQRVPVFV